jgi:hypothetical protein
VAARTAASKYDRIACHRCRCSRRLPEILLHAAANEAAEEKKKRRHVRYSALHRFWSFARLKTKLLVVFGLQHFATTIEAVRADVVTQVGFARGWLDGQVRGNQEIVRTVHTALRRGFFILLNCHDDS